jgi:hypothetical protein
MMAQAVHDRERSDRGYTKATTWGTFFDPESLWQWIASKSRKGSRLIVVAHNLAYDLRISKAFVVLSGLGWSPDKIKLDPGCAAVHWMKNGASIQMIDLYSYLPMSLTDIGLAVGLPKLEMPETQCDEYDWLGYCKRDVEILRAAYWRIIEFTREEDLGNWQPSGSGQAFAAWRHRFYEERILVGNDESVRYLEREAAWTGRCEVWQHGTYRKGPYTEWDYEMAYGNTATDEHLPIAAKAISSKMTIARVRRYYPKVMVLARVRVTTEIPIVPTKGGERILWPVGTFDTTLWSPELLLAHENGATIEFIEARAYSTMPALKRFMEWALSIASGNGPGEDPIIRQLAKQWTRTLVGRLGMHYHSWEPFATTETSDCVLMEGVNLDTGDPYKLMWIGHTVLKESELLEFPDGTPAIMSFVMSKMRVRLWNAIETAGPAEVLYMDTDSLITSDRGSRRLEKAIAEGKLSGLRRKSSYRHLDLWAPRQITTDSMLKAAGVSKRALKVGSNEYVAEAWQSLKASLKQGTHDKVVIKNKTVHLRGTDHRRKHLPNGKTAPFRLPEEAKLI